MADSLKGIFGGGEAGQGSDPGDRDERRAERRAARRAARLQDDPDRYTRARDYVSRYTTGDPSEGYDEREAVEHFEYVRQHASPEQLQRAMQQTVQNMNPNQRAAFAEMLQRRQRGQGMVEIERSGQQQGGGGGGLFDMLGGLLGGGMAGGMAGGASGGGDPFGGLLGGLLGGGGQDDDDRYRRQQQTQDAGGGLGDILGSPLGKVVLGGVAAYAMKEMMDGNR